MSGECSARLDDGAVAGAGWKARELGGWGLLGVAPADPGSFFLSEAGRGRGRGRGRVRTTVASSFTSCKRGSGHHTAKLLYYYH